MADVKFSDFTATVTPLLTDEVVGLQSNINKRTTLQKVKDLFLTGLTTDYIPIKTASGLGNSSLLKRGAQTGCADSDFFIDNGGLDYRLMNNTYYKNQIDGSANYIVYNSNYGRNDIFIHQNTGDIDFIASVKTGAPTGGAGAATWRMGGLVVGASVPDATQYVEVEVAGALRKFVIAT